ncbi:MAG: L,D-transpeptidase catalytic domain [Chitinophagaceae bacterium]|nr:L,D-transpeptidase catalytic domain [Chitinophagaceae bacterium]
MKCTWLTLSVLFLYISETHAQAKEVPVEVIVEQLAHKNIRGFLERSTEAVYKFYHDDAVASNVITDKCLIVKSSDAEKSINVSQDPVLNAARKLKIFKINPASGTISLKMETYEDDKGDPCEHDKGDDYYFVTPLEIKLNDLNPGVLSAPYTITTKDDKFTAVIRVRYGIPAPEVIKQDNAELVNDVTKAVTLKSALDLNNKTNLTYSWEYKVDDENTWKELGNKTVSESVVFYPVRDAFKKPLKTNQTLHVRMKAVSPELASDYTPSYDIQFTPEVPVIEKNDIKVSATCPGEPSGGISIKGVKASSDNIAYYIIKGKQLDAENYPDVINTSNKIKQGIVANGNTVDVQKLEEGDYLIILYSANMPVGKVFAQYGFNVSKYPQLIIKSQDVKEATCATIPDGQIMIETEGGNPGKLTYAIVPASGKAQQFGRSAIFSELAPGNYTVFVKDECGQNISTKEMEVIRKAPIVKGKLGVTMEPVNEFANGAINISLEGGTGQYKYIIYKNNNAEHDKQVSSAPFVIDHLGKGSYRLKVTDISAPLCPGWDTTFSLTGKTIMMDTAKPSSDTARAALMHASTPAQSDLKISTAVVRDTAAEWAAYKKSKYAFYKATEKKAVVYAPLKLNGATKNDYYIVVEKSKYQLNLFNSNNDLLASYPVVFGNDDMGDKMFEGDRRTPEGTFEIINKKEHDKWDKFLALNYPTDEDYKKFNERKAKGLLPADAKIGGEIGLHGTWPDDDITVDKNQNWTWGCISTKNAYIDQLFTCLPVGTKVIIRR